MEYDQSKKYFWARGRGHFMGWKEGKVNAVYIPEDTKCDGTVFLEKFLASH